MPKIVNHELRQRELAKAAFETVCNLGITNTTMRTVAEAASCSTGTLVHYFQDKDDILIAALNYAYDRCGARMQTIIDSHKPNLLDSIAIASLPTDKEHQEEWRVWLEFWGRAVTQTPLKESHKGFYKQWLRGLARAMKRGIDHGELNPHIKVANETVILAALIDGIGIHATLDPTRLPPNKQKTALRRYLEKLRIQN